jgi:hypothetical protein
MSNEIQTDRKMREYRARDPLAAFALQVLRPTWIGGQPQAGEGNVIAWEGLGVKGVPIVALRAGLIIFQFDQSDEYSGGAVPGYRFPKDIMRKPRNVTDAEKARDELGYRRFGYMNGFLFALYSGLSTIQHKAAMVQEPIDPNNYFAALSVNGAWQIYHEPERRIENHPVDTIT